MKKILLISDSPYATTGLGRMSKYFLKMLPEFKWYVWGIMHPEFVVRNGIGRPVYNPKDFGHEHGFELITPDTYTNDLYGLDHAVKAIRDIKPDYLITSMDFNRIFPIVKHIKDLRFVQDFKWINYFPVDREDIKDMEVDAFRYPDVNVVITKYGQRRFLEFNEKLDIKQIYHPLDLEEFPLHSKKEIEDFKLKTFTGINKGTFVMGTVNRSFARKDTARLVRAFTEVSRRTDNTFFYVHGKSKTFEGLNLAELAVQNDVRKKSMSFLPETINEIDGIANADLNKIYQSLDLFVTFSTGEGFGYSTVEALATETPIVVPDNTCFPELVQDFGYILPTSEYTFHYNSNTSMWPVVGLNKSIEQLMYIYNNYSEAKKKIRGARKWVKDNLSLDVIAEQWRQILK